MAKTGLIRKVQIIGGIWSLSIKGNGVGVFSVRVEYKQQLMLAILRRSLRVSFGSVQQFSNQELTSAHKYVQQTLRSRTWVTYMLASYLPQPIRQPYYAIHLFDMELTKISENAREPSLAQGKLNFWRQAIHRIYAGEKPQPEPLSIALHHAIHNHPLTNGYFQRMIAVRGTQVSSRSIATMGDMRRMADDSKSTLIALTLELLRIQVANEHMQQVIGYLGQAIGICEYLRRVPYSLRNNRFLLPQDLLAKYSLTVRNIWDRVYGKPSEELFDVALQVASYGKRAFEQAVKIYREHPQSFPEHSFRAFLRGVQTEYYLQNLEKYNFNLFDPNLNNFSPVKLPYRVYNAAKAKQFSITDQSKK